MGALWRVIDCSRCVATIRSERGAVVVAPRDGPATRVPTADIACVLLGLQTTISGGALHKLMAHGAAVLVCDWRGVPSGAAYSWRDHGRVAARRRAQSQLSVPRQKSAWQGIVKAKIRHQARVLDELGASGDGLRRLASGVRSGDPGNSEGRAARLYWPQVFGRIFHRDPGAGEGSNAMLDYCYTIVRGHAIRAVLAAGLEPSLGVFHRHRENMFCLADDVIEPFRPVVDLAVARLVGQGRCDVDSTRHELVAIASSPFSRSGYTIPSALEDFAQTLGRYVEGEISRLAAPTWDAEVEL